MALCGILCRLSFVDHNNKTLCRFKEVFCCIGRIFLFYQRNNPVVLVSPTSIGYVGSFNVHGDAVGDASLNLQFSRSFGFDGGAEGHLEVSSIVLGEAFLERLLEERRVEGVAHHYVAPGRIDARLHLVKACV